MADDRTIQIPCQVLSEMYRTNRTIDASGAEIEIDAQIRLSYAEALYNFVRKRKPKTVVEIGLANGASALSMLTALKENGTGRLISIDPVQNFYWSGAGVTSIQRAGLADLHRLVEDYDYVALPQLLGEGIVVDFAYIDGWHSFDYATLDWFYIDHMIPVGGVITFNDAGWRAVHKSIRCFQTHRKYREIDVGLARTSKGSNPIKTAIKRLRGIVNEDRYFEKIENWMPPFDYYAKF